MSGSPTREWTRAYEKLPTGFLMRAYRNMESRITGVQSKKHHLYEGKSLMPREEFYLWAHNSKKFWLLWRAWKQSGHDQRLTPSPNRIDPDKGYEAGNVEWVTHSENSARIRRQVPEAGFCKNGHEKFDGSFYVRTSAKGVTTRRCKECHKEAAAAKLAAKKEVA